MFHVYPCYLPFNVLKKKKKKERHWCIEILKKPITIYELTYMAEKKKEDSDHCHYIQARSPKFLLGTSAFLVYMFTLLIHWFISPTEGRCIISWHVLDLPYPIIIYDPLFLEDQARTSEEFLWTKVFLKPSFLASCQSFDSANLSLTGPTTVGWLRESPIRNLPVSSLKEALVLKQLGLQEVLIQPNGWRYH